MTWSVVHDGDGFPRVILTDGGGSSAEVLLYGGQVVSWKNERREELLFTSSKTSVRPQKDVRGGIPIFFPQYGSFKSLDLSGFARNRLWALDSSPAPLPSSPKNHSSVLLISHFWRSAKARGWKSSLMQCAAAASACPTIEIEK
ncbi:putative glucose-6-phosphate 1-epimerase [Dioscorea cayenensis subsp. rotundata]|uniref:Glucose-6-phosphate 1-epimerase n=1 Tax=Dioscorea cayennensis subsp. rotundata TaxID=55577 RepID=A0AB40C2H7_DIOCR|nr:putative glucose-6-phosphate 1-epimerase [Dioscorea cayenensis subsp. rotundata]